MLESDKITRVPESIIDHKCVAGVLLKSANYQKESIIEDYYLGSKSPY